MPVMLMRRPISQICYLQQILNAMKKLTIHVLCMLCLPMLSYAQWGSVKGEGDVVTQEIQLEMLKGVKLGFSGDIILTQGSSQKVVMEGQQNILDNIKRDVDDGIWNVHFDKGVRTAKPVKIYITLATLQEAYVQGSGSISTTNTFHNLGDLEVGVSGSGGLDLSVDAVNIEASVSGSGDIKLQGTAENIEISISGSGDVHAAELRAENCEVAISGSGDVLIYCTSGIESSVSGSGDIRYKGNPAKVKASISGSGDVREID